MGNKKGTRIINVLFTKDNDGTICLVGLYGQLMNAYEEAKKYRKWGYSTAQVEIKNNTALKLPLNKLNWQS